MMRIFVLLISLLSGCVTTQSVESELDGFYSWGHVFEGRSLKVEGENFILDAYTDCIGCGDYPDYPLRGMVTEQDGLITLHHEKLEGENKFRLVLVGKNSYLVQDSAYSQFLKDPKRFNKGIKAKNYLMSYGKVFEKVH